MRETEEITDLARHGLKGRPIAKQLSVFNTMRKTGMSNLCVTNIAEAATGRGWETMAVIIDSGASVAVFNPRVAAAYPLQESEASKNGDEYEIANGDCIPCLGEKKIAVLTTEGTLRGYGSQCAEVSESKPLQSVRALNASGHAVCFGLGPEGNEHVIINKLTGEVNYMEDDGINYIQRLLVVPPDQIEAVQSAIYQLNMMNEQSFAGPGS